MKNRFIRILSALLIIAFLVSCLSVFAFAETAGTEESEDELSGTLVYYRNFSEGWDYTNGISKAEKNNYFGIEYEEASDFSYNYFLRIEATNPNISSVQANDGFLELRYKSNQPKEYSSVFMFDIKTDDKVDLGSVIYGRSIGGSNGFTTDYAKLVGGKLYLPNPGVAITTAQNSVGALNDKWVTVAVVYNITDDEGNNLDDDYRICPTCYTKYKKSDCKGQDCGKSYKDATGKNQTDCKGKLNSDTMLQMISARIYVGYAEDFDISTAKVITSAEKTITTSYDSSNNVTDVDTSNIDLSTGTRYYDTVFCIKANQTRGQDIIRFGLPSRSSQESLDKSIGQSYCLDNIKVYNLNQYLGPYKDEAGATQDNYSKVLVSNEAVATLGTADKPYGDNISPSAPKTVEILSGSGEKSDLQYVNEALLMKVGVEYGYYAKTRKPILTDSLGNAYGAPIKLNGIVYVPFQAVLDHIGYPCFEHEDGFSYDFSTDKGSALLAVDRDTATVGGTLVPLTAAPKRITDEKTQQQYVVIAMDDIETLFPGYYITYDDMGLIVLAEKDNVLDRENDLTIMVDLMASFIYDFVSGDTYYNMVKENTKGFQHPYLLADQEYFDGLRNVYTGAEQDELLKGYLDTFLAGVDSKNASSNVRVGDTYVKFRYGWTQWTKDGVTADTKVEDVNGSYLRNELVYVEEDGSYINGTIINPHDSDLAKNSSTYNGGYDWDGGRLNESGNYNNYIRDLALAYQITGKEAYGRIAYEAAVKMGKWQHWGQGHFLNCADATTPYALAYDWMYNKWKEWGYDLAPIENAIANLGVYHGTLVSGIEGEPRCIRERRQGTSAYYTTMTNNWNAVCTSGMVTGALAIIGIKDLVTAEERAVSGTNYDKMVSNAKWILEHNTETLARNGLSMYAPDGSYIESPNYWRYSTVSLFHMIWVLNTATGDDMGFLNMWGMDKTFYFACQIEFPSSIKTDTDSAYGPGIQFWNYHDSNQEYLDTCMFFYAAQMLGQQSLAALRIEQIPKKGVTIYDLLGYKSEYKDLDLEKAKNELTLSYKIESCDGVISRDSWGDGSLYTGLMGNRNDVSHGQVDSGNFIYANKNYIWFCDLGAEDYNVYSYWTDEYRYTYTRMSAEGANVVCVYSAQDEIPYGQALDGGGELVKFEENEYGMYAIIDNATAYGSLTNEARRGILFTNDRQTVVIQDKIMFSGVQSVLWLGNTGAKIVLSEDKKTAYLVKKVNDVEYTIRCSIVSPISSLSFSVLTSEDYVLDKTMRPNQSQNLGGVAEKNRSKYQRLAIDSGLRLSFECAVVIEVVENQYMTAADFPVHYEWTNMNEWKIENEFNAAVVDDSVIGNAGLADIKTYGDIADKYVQEGYAFSTRTSEFFFNMAKAAACVEVFREQMFKEVPALYDAYKTYVVNLAKYRSFQKDINAAITDNMSIGVSIGGFMG